MCSFAKPREGDAYRPLATIFKIFSSFTHNIGLKMIN
jgi:hypothetical protein